MALVDPLHEPSHDVEREALFFAVLRERTRPVEVLRPTEDDVRRRMREADDAISEWLDEAEAEGARILERARFEAARVQSEVAEETAELLADMQALQVRLVALAARAGTVPSLPAAPTPRRRPVLGRLRRRG